MKNDARDQFAQGFHNGVADQRRNDWDKIGRFRRGNLAYRAGYLRGHLASHVGEQTLSSAAAWAEVEKEINR